MGKIFYKLSQISSLSIWSLLKKIKKYLDSEKQGQSLYPPVYTSSMPTPMQSGENQGSNLPYPSSPPQYNQAPMNPSVVITQQPSIITQTYFLWTFA